jgi:hypothetical protein
MIARARHHRFMIGLIAAYALLLSAMLPAFASVADPLQAYLGAHLCGPGESQGDDAPASPVEHQQKCQLCGPNCSMGGPAPVATLADGLISVAPFDLTADVPYRATSAAPAPLSLYPSDAFSQGPPQAA